MAFCSNPSFFFLGGGRGQLEISPGLVLHPCPHVTPRARARCCNPIRGDLQQPSGEGAHPKPTPPPPPRDGPSGLCSNVRSGSPWQQGCTAGRWAGQGAPPPPPINQLGGQSMDKDASKHPSPPPPETPTSNIPGWPTPALGVWDLDRLQMLEGDRVRLCPHHAGHPWGGLGPRDPPPIPRH